MKLFFAKLIIFTLVLTAPLSFTGDRCPDFKPDCVKSSYAEKARAATVTQRRILRSRQVSQRNIAELDHLHRSFSKVTLLEPFQHVHKDSPPGRAPPRSTPASA